MGLDIFYNNEPSVFSGCPGGSCHSCQLSVWLFSCDYFLNKYVKLPV